MNNNPLETVGYIDDRLIEKSGKYTVAKKKHTWTKWAAMAACLCLVAAGTITTVHTRHNHDITGEMIPPADVGSFDSDSSVPSQGAARTADAGEISAQELPDTGIFIPAVELPDTAAGVEFDMLGLVVYNGGIYTQSEIFNDADALKIDSLTGEYLGYAAGSIDEWSSQDEYAEEFASSIEGEVYEVLGYDTGFRICVRKEYADENGENHLFIEFLDRLNGITLTTGADLFETRLHLRNRIEAIRWQSHDDWNYAMGNIKTADLDPALWEEFLDRIDEGVLINTWDPESSDDTIYDTENQAHIILTMDDDTVIRLRLIEGGYVGYDALGWYFVQIPGETFDAVFASCGGNVQ